MKNETATLKPLVKKTGLGFMGYVKASEHSEMLGRSRSYTIGSGIHRTTRANALADARAMLPTFLCVELSIVA